MTDVADNLALAVGEWRLFQRLYEQAERVQWLAQVMAGGGEEARLGDVGLLGDFLAPT